MDSWRTADSAALEPDGSRWRSLHCIRLSGRGRTCTPTATRNLRLQMYRLEDCLPGAYTRYPQQV